MIFRVGVALKVTGFSCRISKSFSFVSDFNLLVEFLSRMHEAADQS